MTIQVAGEREAGPKATILVLEDDTASAQMLDALLADAGYAVVTVERGREAMDLLSQRPFDIALFDVNIPDFSGIEVLRELREHRLDLPVIFLSGETSIEYAIDALRFRAFDFVSKPFDPAQLLQLVERALAERKLEVARVSHVTEMEAELYRLQHQAFHDPLTGLPNRALLDDRLAQAIAQAQRTSRRVAVLFLDLDRFKPINDLHGHENGDRVLKEVARRFSAPLRSADTLARLGGDEFVAVIPQIENPAVIGAIVEKLQAALRAPFSIDGQRVHLSVSVGCAVFPDDGLSPEALLESADAAMYQHKHRGAA
ncbi:MAG: diguanylate cyclase domain-containing protein [bacterium]|jgi:diguanylate cyclase (GGDEF)-like protein|nr:diguanylate cyclase [Betaproteobacteria bacterium]